MGPAMRTAMKPAMKIAVLEGDITRQDADAIVNAANTALRPGGGVDGAITRAAGKVALAEREALIAAGNQPPLPTGEALATGGGDLKARWIIHTAGPVYSGRDSDADLLARCHTSCLHVADQLGAGSVAFPAISTGVYGYPAASAAPVAISAVMDATTSVREVRFVLFGAPMLEVFLQAARDQAQQRGWQEDSAGLFSALRW